jgi:hypothetical protein
VGLALTIGFLVACSDPPSADGVGERVPEEPPRRRIDPRAELYDAEGVPRESSERVAGLVLPRGLTAQEALSENRRHIYTSEVPPQKLLRYFGPRLYTMNIEQRGEAVLYREALPRGVQGGAVKLDVTIQPSALHASRVEIYERPPPPPAGTVIPEAEIRRQLESLTKNRE